MRDTSDDIEEKAETHGFLLGAIATVLMLSIALVATGIFLLIT